MKKLRRIEPVKEEKKKLKVAAYCRVSTKFESQQSSIDLQISNYETVIQSNSQWEYAGVYKDFEELIRQYDPENAFIYCDPPYYQTEGHYAVVFKKESRQGEGLFLSWTMVGFTVNHEGEPITLRIFNYRKRII